MFIQSTQTSFNYNKNLNFNGSKFLQKNPQLARDIRKVTLFQDPLSQKPIIQMPKDELDKELTREFLQMHQRASKFLRKTHEMFELKTTIIMLGERIAKGEKTPELIAQCKALCKQGKLSSIMNTLDKQINDEAKKVKPALDYLYGIIDTGEELIERKKITIGQLNKGWQEVKKNNINKNGEYTEDQLLKIVESGVNPNAAAADKKDTSIKKSKSASQPAAKAPQKKIVVVDPGNPFLYHPMSGLVGTIQKAYEDKFRSTMDFYGYNQDLNKIEANMIKEFSAEKSYLIESCQNSGFDFSMSQIYQLARAKYLKATDDLVAKAKVLAIGEIINEMKLQVADIKKCTEEMQTLIDKLGEEKDSKKDEKIKKELEAKVQEFNTKRQDWMKNLSGALYYDNENRSRAAAYDIIGDLQLEIKTLNEKLNKTKGKKAAEDIKAQIADKEEKIKNIKNSFNGSVQNCPDFIEINVTSSRAGIMETNYNFVTEKNKTLNKYKEFMQKCFDNNDEIPEELWDEILAGDYFYKN